MPAPDADSATTLRIDKWLWFCRFFKSRSQATDAVSGGLVHVNGERAKPSRLLKAGDELAITKDEIRFVVVVTAMPVRRGPATEAQRNFTETEQSRATRESIQANRRLAPPAPDSRPGKRDRRLLRDLRRR